ncbi:MAG: hypothetical protein ACO24Z_06090, partial [Arenimonas sp.]
MTTQVASSEPRVPFRTVAISVVVLWAMYFILASARWEVLGIGHSGEMMLRRLVVVLGGMAVTLALWTLLRLFDAAPMWRKALAALVLSLPASLLLAHINNAVFADLNAKVEKIITEDVLGSGAADADTAASENEPALFPEGEPTAQVLTGD